MFSPSGNLSPSPNYQTMPTENPSTFLHFPSPFFLDDDDYMHGELFPGLLFEQDEQIFHSMAVASEAKIESVESQGKNLTKRVIETSERMTTTATAPRKKKDRHSKIYTAQGPRDRRMRLSVQVARKFFDLQDMLDFDKASKTIEWLFSKSKGPIKELTESVRRLNPSCSAVPCYTSESEVVPRDKKSMEVIGEDRKSRQSTSFDPVAKRESREKARARARERTKEKMKMKSSSFFDESNLQNGDEPYQKEKLGQLDSVCSPKRFSGNKAFDDEEQSFSNLFFKENPINQDQSPNSTLVVKPDAEEPINPNCYNSVFMNPSIGHDGNHISILIRNYLSTSNFGFSPDQI